MTRDEALALLRLETDRDLPNRGYASLVAAHAAAEALTIVLEVPYISFKRGYKFCVSPATGEIQLTTRKR